MDAFGSKELIYAGTFHVLYAQPVQTLRHAGSPQSGD